MVVILSPSKTMIDSVPETTKQFPWTKPEFQLEAAQIASCISALSKDELAHLMKLSDKLTDQTWQRFQVIHSTQAIGKQMALFSYTGEVYSGLHEQTLTEENLLYAQNHLRILSGMYGVLRPLDQIMPYRLEMATKLMIPPHKNLYTFWRDKITTTLNQTIQKSQSKFLANLASDEYSKAIHLNQISASVISFGFHELQNGVKKFISFNAKRARGLMASFIVRNQIKNPEQLISFDTEGYRYDMDNSTDVHFAFVREKNV